MIKTVILSLVFLACSVGVILLFMFDLDWGLILSYIFLASVVLIALAFWLIVAVGLICCAWSYLQPRAELNVDGHVISIRYTRSTVDNWFILTGHPSKSRQLLVVRAPVTEPIEMDLGELSVNRTGHYPATFQIEGEVFEFPMSKSTTSWRYGEGCQSVLTRYSGYFHHVKGPVHFAGEVEHVIYHELETSEIIALHQVS